MKSFWFVLLVAGAGLALHAQPNAPVSETNLPPATTASSNAPPTIATPTNAMTEITSDSVNFDLKSRVAVYRGDVHVTDPQVNMTCDQLTVHLPAQSGGRPDRIVAETNVVINFTDGKGQTNRAVADQAVYTYGVTASETNELITLTGHAKLENQSGTLHGEPIIWDRIRGTVSAQNQRMELRAVVAPTNLLSTPQPGTNQ